MSKYDELISSFPYPLSSTEAILMMAQVTAEELSDLSDNNDLVGIYTRVDELGSDLLDILAKDFKIDWWDADATLEAKRKTFRECFSIHRKLGTVGAVKEALTAAYSGAKVIEWFTEGGTPYHYRIEVGLGTDYGDETKLTNIEQRTRIYGNVRSVLDKIEFVSAENKTVYCGMAIANGEKGVFTLGTT